MKFPATCICCVHVGDPEVVEMPWWAYGPQGMRLWFPSLLNHAAMHNNSSRTSSSSNIAGQLSATLGPPGVANVTSYPTPGDGVHPSSSYPQLTPKSHSQLTPKASMQSTPTFARGIGGPTDMELEFDREVYPVGISLADAAIVGVTQRLMRGAASGDGQVNPSSCFSNVARLRVFLMLERHVFLKLGLRVFLMTARGNKT